MKGSNNMLTASHYYSFGMPRFDFSDSDATGENKDKSNPDDKTKEDVSLSPQRKSITEMSVEELRAEVMKLNNIANTNNAKVIRVQNDYQKAKDLIRDLEQREKEAKEAALEENKKKGEYEPIIATKDQEISDLKAKLEKAEQDTKENLEKMQLQNIHNIVYRSLMGQIRNDWVKGDNVDPIKEAMKNYDFDSLVLNDAKEPTNVDEVNKAFLDRYPLFAKSAIESQPGKGNILGPGSGTSIPTDGITEEMKVIADHVNLPASTIKRRLTGDDKERWLKDWDYIIRGMEENSVFK